MAAAGGSTTGSAVTFVWIKLAAADHSKFAYLEVGGALLAGRVAALACGAYPRWRLDADQVSLHLAAEPGDEPGQGAIGAALARAPLPVGECVPAGSWLVAVPTHPAAASPREDIGRLAQSIENLRLDFTALTAKVSTVVAQQVATADFNFSAAPPSVVRSLLGARDIHERDLPLPPIDHLKPATRLIPYVWAQTMTAAARDLQLLLERWVKSGSAPALEHAFCDVQSLAPHSPLVIHELGVGTFKGVSDMVVLCHGVSAGRLMSPLANCAVAVDWKTPAALAKGVRQQAALQVLGLAHLAGEYSQPPPVFFTDLKSHFLCFCLTGRTLGCYVGADGTNCLSLEEGVGLVRYFLQQDRVMEVARIAAAVAASVGGGAVLARAAAQPAEAPKAAAEREAMGGGGGGWGGGATDENDAPPPAMEGYSAADDHALNIAELQGTLAIAHELTEHGGISREGFFQLDE